MKISWIYSSCYACWIKVFPLTKYKQKNILKKQERREYYVRSLSFIRRNRTDQQWYVFFIQCRRKINRHYEHLTGGLSLFINFVNLVQGNYYAAGTGLLFCFTYLFVALSKFLKASPIPFAWFSTFVAINAVIFGTIEGFTGSTALGITPDLRWAAIWYLWAILWGTAFVEDICGKKLGKFVPYLQVFEGIVTAWVPGVMMLLQIW